MSRSRTPDYTCRCERSRGFVPVCDSWSVTQDLVKYQCKNYRCTCTHVPKHPRDFREPHLWKLWKVGFTDGSRCSLLCPRTYVITDGIPAMNIVGLLLSIWVQCSLLSAHQTTLLPTSSVPDPEVVERDAFAIFNSVHHLLRLWGNILSPNGFSFTRGTVLMGTNLYHGRGVCVMHMCAAVDTPTYRSLSFHTRRIPTYLFLRNGWPSIQKCPMG